MNLLFKEIKSILNGKKKIKIYIMFRVQINYNLKDLITIKIYKNRINNR